jgi:xanthine dehydrogenase accessory factor
LGIKKTHNNRIERLKNSGFSENIIKRVNGPIGLPINAAKPNEIAISIMSEIIASLRHHDYLDLDMRDDWKLR